MAVSVACIGGVRSAANVAGSALQRESRAWLAGDLAVTTGESIDEQQYAALERMRSRGIEWTVVTTTLTMGASDQSPDPSLLAVKAVDPGRYPLYGALAVEPPQTLSAVLQPDTAVLSKDAMTRFHVGLGDAIQIGGRPFRIAGAIAAEPDRFSGVTSLAVRCLLSERAFERTGIARSGDSMKFRVLFRLPAGADWEATRRTLRETFPEADLTDFRGANRDAVAILERTALFLNLTALLALALGAVGLAMAARQHIEERAYTLAVMKMIGGDNRQLAGMFFLQVIGLAAIGFVLGLPLGWAIRASVLSMASRYVALPRANGVDYPAILETAAAGIAALIPTLAGAGLAIVRLRPAIMLRRDFGEAPASTARPVSGVAWSASCVVVGVLAARLLGSWNLGVILIAAMSGSVLLAFLLSGAIVAGLRLATRPAAMRRAPMARHALANLCRPGNRGRPLIVAMAIGLMMMIATFQLNRAIAGGIIYSMPFDRPDMLLPAVEAELVPELRAFLQSQPGVQKVLIEAQARGSLTNLDGRRIAGLVGCGPGGAGAVVSEDVARRAHWRVGSGLRFEAQGRIVSATVREVRPMTQIEAVWHSVQMDCSGLAPDSLFYHAALRIRPDRIEAVRRAIVAEYPALPVGTQADLVEIVGQMMRDSVLLARLVAWYALGSSLAVLVAVVSASRGLRLREMAVLAALGARRRTLIQLYTFEFAAIGIFAAAIGSVLACAFTAVMVSAVLQGLHVSVEWWPLLVAMLAASVLSITAGWLPAWGLLRCRPLEALRGE